jgi:hypothetical protein
MFHRDFIPMVRNTCVWDPYATGDALVVHGNLVIEGSLALDHDTVLSGDGLVLAGGTVESLRCAGLRREGRNIVCAGNLTMDCMDLCVSGDLVVEGAILNTSPVYGSALVVGGTVHAQWLLTGGTRYAFNASVGLERSDFLPPYRLEYAAEGYEEASDASGVKQLREAAAWISCRARGR